MGVLKLFSTIVFAQLLIQLVGLLCGILIIRNLSIQEYSWYTISNTILGAMNSLMDGGIITGIITQASKVWTDRTKLGIVIKSGLELRKLFSLIVIIICGVALMVLLNINGANFKYSLLIFICLLPILYANLTDVIYEIGPKLHQSLNSVQMNQIYANLGRLLLTVLTLFFFPSTPLFILAVGVPRLLANIQLRKIALRYVDLNVARGSIESRKKILEVVKRVLPLNIYYIFSAQISIWLLSFNGDSSAIAQVGALFRFGTFLTAFQVAASSLFIPRIAKMNNGKFNLCKYMFKTQIFILLVFVFITIFFLVFNSSILWLLGDNYKGLERELILTIIIFGLNIFGNFQYNLNISRGWIMHPFFIILINILSIFFSAQFFDISNLKGVLNVNILSLTFLVLLHVVYGYYQLFKENI